MDLNAAFDDYQKTVDADPEQVALARERRDVFTEALQAEGDVVEVFGSGSLRRSTQLKPVHDVDLIVVFDPEQHTDWGSPGTSSQDALDHVRMRVNSLLGATNGSVEQLVRLGRTRDRAVKCFIDPPEQDDAFTVDVMPAMRQPDNTLRLPSTRQGEWNTADPEYLIREVQVRQEKWSYFRPMVRVLKLWRHGVPTKVKSLVIEVLALECLPVDKNRPEALKAFFTAAAVEIGYGIEDPAGHCGAIQPDLDVAALRSALESARDLAKRACAAAADGDTDGAAQIWQELFGEDFPVPEEKNTTQAAAVVGPTLLRPRPVKDAPQG